ncbi:MAG: FKBP-type peptidyl-prolyl cis-trans isomerase [Pirellulaceae bacterium]
MKVLGEKVMARAKAAAAQLVKSNAYLEQNKKQMASKQRDTGLQYKVVKSGNGSCPAMPIPLIHYEGKLIDGTIFDSSIKRGEPAVFGVGQVIPGWTEAARA